LAQGPLVALALAGEEGDAELRRAQTHVEDDVDDVLELPVNFGPLPPSFPAHLLEFVNGVEGRLLSEVLLRLPMPPLQTNISQLNNKNTCTYVII
jgi:hypothetical protein